MIVLKKTKKLRFIVCIQMITNTQTHTHLARLATVLSVNPFAARLRLVSEHSSYKEKNALICLLSIAFVLICLCAEHDSCVPVTGRW